MSENTASNPSGEMSSEATSMAAGVLSEPPGIWIKIEKFESDEEERQETEQSKAVFEPEVKLEVPTVFPTPVFALQPIAKEENLTDEISQESELRKRSRYLRNPFSLESKKKNKIPSCTGDEGTLAYPNSNKSLLYSQDVIKPEDEEHMFFLSLLPHIKRIPQHLQLAFRIEVMNLVAKFAYPSLSTHTVTSHSQSSVAEVTSTSQSVSSYQLVGNQSTNDFSSPTMTQTDPLANFLNMYV